MEFRLKCNRYILLLLCAICFQSCKTNRATYSSAQILSDYDHYKRFFVAGLIYKARGDTVWIDKPYCWTPDIIDDKAIMEIDSLTELSLAKLLNELKIAVEPHNIDSFGFDEQCLANELLIMYHSKELDNLARKYEKRKKRSAKM